jgi:(1->4)-alpha-D-glucan 1-alpha-D-glucosylmutase
VTPDVGSTYRVQLHAGFGFDDAAEIVDLLSELGITHLYCSPYLQARAGSMHGYDVVDQSKISDELGGEAGHRRLLEALDRNGMGHILDIVPNHMTISESTNAWWWDVLKHGPSSHYASYFDIDWTPPEAKLRKMLLVPILGDHYGRILDRGEISVDAAGDEPVIRYFDHTLPLSPESLSGLPSIDELNSDVDALHELLEAQNYRLAYWRSADQELNYRRFFSINDLAALRMENPDVFDKVHELVLDLVERGDLDGLRVDHIDGLRDPEGYLTQLRSWCPRSYVVVEKILEPGEELPSTWPIEGTTGYDFLGSVGGLFVDPAGERPLTDLYQEFTGIVEDLDDLKREKKVLAMTTELAADVERLTELFAAVSEDHRETRDFMRIEMRATLRETIAAFPVYRTYIRVTPSTISKQDEGYVMEATSRASERRPDLEDSLFRFLADILLLRVEGEAAFELAMRFQQTTGPVMAKGVEDTLFYTYNRLACLNEVGGDPANFGITIDRFHESMSLAQRDWPLSMIATSTHDTKRSEDVRARIALLSEIPERWSAAVHRWRENNDRYWGDTPADRNMEYLLYQTLVGAHPLPLERAGAYMEKASKEAKERTNWTSPDPDYDAALRGFVRGVLADDGFQADLGAFVGRLIEPGRVNSLAQTLIRMTAAGVPDTYQGTELWDLSLVDPDNRRPIDYDLRREVLARVRERSVAEIWRDRGDGGPKLLVIERALALRKRLPAAFGETGSYEPLAADGPNAEHVVAFVRGGDAITVAPCRVLGAAGGWPGTTLDLPDGTWVDQFTGATVEGRVEVASTLLGAFPVALLVRSDV